MTVVLKSRFPQIIAELNPRVRTAVEQTAEVVERKAKERVPVDEGDLQEAIHTRHRGGNSYEVRAGRGDVFYGHMVEHGTSHSAPRPFLVPALEESKDEFRHFVTAALRGL